MYDHIYKCIYMLYIEHFIIRYKYNIIFMHYYTEAVYL
jgi:hypothetical protein